jgi:hypothetical protein
MADQKKLILTKLFKG